MQLKNKKVFKTIFYDRHIALKAKMVEFGGWNMPLCYSSGIFREHLMTRKKAGIFDVSHMGRFIFSGRDALPFLQHVLSNNAAALEVGESQYTIITDIRGGAIDDAYLYRFVEDEYLLVVNAANREKDWDYFQSFLSKFEQVGIIDKTFDLAMISLQGPLLKSILLNIIDSGDLPEPLRNYLSIVSINGSEVLVARTGYTGEPLSFELFIKNEDALMIWDKLIDRGVIPVGLGARDTLRLEAGLPLYGHELGFDPKGKEIPIFASPLAQFAVSFSPFKGDFIGREELRKQFTALKKIMNRDYTLIEDLPSIIMPLELLDKGVARAGNKVYFKNKYIGYITSGTVVPYWETICNGIETKLTDETSLRAICLALIRSNLWEGDEVEIEVMGKRVRALVMPYHLRSEAPPYAYSITCEHLKLKKEIVTKSDKISKNVKFLLKKTIENTIWRQQKCINLIPSEQTPSRMVRLLSIMDPTCRYAEHKKMKAFYDTEVFYYQGIDFIAKVEDLLKKELRKYLNCTEVETRAISGQMANIVVFSAMVDYLNRADRKSEQRRIRYVLNHHIISGGHLSAQPMGALQDFVARDPRTEKPAVVNFPVLSDNPYKIDINETYRLIEKFKPELIIFGKSVTLHKEPVKEIRKFIDDIGIDCIVMYDMAHVLGLVGPYFQEPFVDGTNIVTGSTHKTYFGTQRGIIASNYKEPELGYKLWETIERRAFPGSVSNHHLGTLLGLLMAAYEMNTFKEEYQNKVISNAKAFAVALAECGLNIAGDSKVSYTQTHQVIINVGYARGPEIAKRLEDNNIIVNYQATAEEEGFTAAGALRTGVSEMTRFGMEKEDFVELAQYIYSVIVKKRNVKDKITDFRKRFLEMKYCFSGNEFDKLIQKLHELI